VVARRLRAPAAAAGAVPHRGRPVARPARPARGADALADALAETGRPLPSARLRLRAGTCRGSPATGCHCSSTQTT
jgi:hypothetical protein